MARKIKNSKKLTEWDKLIVIQRFADFDTPKQVVEYLKVNHDIEITERQAQYYQADYKDEILTERRRLNEAEELITIPVANKRYRMKVRQMLVDDIFQKGLWAVMGQAEVTQKEVNPKTKEVTYVKRIVPKLKGNHGSINQALDSAKNELEPSKFALTDKDGDVSQPLIQITNILEGMDETSLRKLAYKNELKKTTNGKSNGK